MTLEDRFSDAIRTLLGDDLPDTLGLAVSGGGDSMALLHLAYGWAQTHGVTLAAATVNHHLRPEAADEAAMVAQTCAKLGVAHDVLHWEHEEITGNLQAAARDARRALLTEWSERRGPFPVCLGHTADDQAETVLMRLARGSGVDGLAGMDLIDPGTGFLRPLLSISRAALRDWLTARGAAWVEDSSNQDTAFTRVKARQALEILAPLGLTRDRLVETAGHMARARTALWMQAAVWAETHVQAEAGDLIFDAEALQVTRSDSAARVLAAAIMWMGGAEHRPRFDALRDAVQAVAEGQARTLGGVILRPEDGGARMLREASAVADPVEVTAGAQFALWDRRWQVFPPETSSGLLRKQTKRGRFPAGCRLGALGPRISDCPDWRGTGLSRESLMASPAVTLGDRLIAAPVAGMGAGWRADLLADFPTSLSTRR